jgi:dipeptide/tripeptide permease
MYIGDFMIVQPEPRAVYTSGKDILGHPRGLATLAGTELWERISFHGMDRAGRSALQERRCAQHARDVTGALGQSYGWHYGFGFAGIGMLVRCLRGWLPPP